MQGEILPNGLGTEMLFEVYLKDATKHSQSVCIKEKLIVKKAVSKFNIFIQNLPYHPLNIYFKQGSKS